MWSTGWRSCGTVQTATLSCLWAPPAGYGHSQNLYLCKNKRVLHWHASLGFHQYRGYIQEHHRNQSCCIKEADQWPRDLMWVPGNNVLNITMPPTPDRHPTSFSATRTCDHPASLPRMHGHALFLVLATPLTVLPASLSSLLGQSAPILLGNATSQPAGPGRAQVISLVLPAQEKPEGPAIYLFFSLMGILLGWEGWQARQDQPEERKLSRSQLLLISRADATECSPPFFSGLLTQLAWTFFLLIPKEPGMRG